MPARFFSAIPCLPMMIFLLFSCREAPDAGTGRFTGRVFVLPSVEAPALTRALATKLAALPLACIGKPYPNKPGHVLASDAENLPHAQKTPIFHGCFDWHSSVHMHWTLVRLARLFPELPDRERILTLLDSQFTPAKVAAELAFFRTPHNTTFERTYGWAWLLRLAGEIALWKDPRARAWQAALTPLVRHIRDASMAHLDKLARPVRHGVHANTAFAMDMMLKYAQAVGDHDFEAALARRARDFYLADRDCPAAYEPSGVDFISPCLSEAHLLSQILPPAEFSAWFDAFLPAVGTPGFDNLRAPPQITDYKDYVIGHLVGLNFSRAWSYRGLAAAFPASDGRRAWFASLGAIHLIEGLLGMDRTGYGGEHWLASFATYALTVDTGSQGKIIMDIGE
ncbi:DUF2891 domain-containing protein [Myxococcota bacterium]|nr:DUF2891 domain-containing protein [Myxococcota bacterium]